jgi:hypothetical protein
MTKITVLGSGKDCLSRSWLRIGAAGMGEHMGLIVSFLGSKPSSSDEERLEPFFGHRLTP